MNSQSGLKKSAKSISEPKPQNQNKSILGIYNRDPADIGRSLKRPITPNHTAHLGQFKNFNTPISDKIGKIKVEDNTIEKSIPIDSLNSFKHHNLNNRKIDISIISFY